MSECLDSIIGQGIIDIEVLCIDDGSTDKSLDILTEYAARDARFRILRQSNQYAGVARNRGIDETQGKYLAFLDADDYYLPGSLKIMAERAEKDKLDFIKTAFVYLDDKSGKIYSDLYSSVSCIGLRRQGRVMDFRSLPLRLLNVPDVPWNGLYRRSFIVENAIRFNMLQCSNDRSFNIACLLKAKRLEVVKKATVCYRTGRSGQLIKRREQHFDNQFSSYEIVRELCKGSELSEAIMQQELNTVFSWYRRLRNKENAETLDAQLADFLRSIDTADVGENFLREFAFSAEYYRLALGQDAPKRPPALLRAYRCWQEHGAEYTFAMLSKRIIK